ncbi:MAG: hypothetical protein ACI97A_003144 [Planctomycetota bacterium]|jgi:hypothetical protein
MLDSVFFRDAIVIGEIERSVYLCVLVSGFIHVCFWVRRAIVIHENCLNRAKRQALTTVNALIRIDVEAIWSLVEAIYRTVRYTVAVLTIDTRLTNNVCHEKVLSSNSFQGVVNKPLVPAHLCYGMKLRSEC